MGCGGCLWSLVPMLILIPLYSVVREPITYMLHQSADTAAEIIAVIKGAAPELFSNSFYDQMVAAANIPNFADTIREALPEIGDAVLNGVNFNFLGINLGAIPSINVFSEAWKWDWAHIGAALLPVLSAGQQVLSVKLSQRANNSVITDENGMEDKETAQNSQANQTSKMMTWMMPIITLWIGYSMPGAMSLYWLAGGLARMVEDLILTKHYRKVYDAEDAARLEKYKAEQALEEEKERQRAQRRAENPDGITENTSKKKLQKKQQQAEDAARAAAAREYAAKKGMATEEDGGEKQTLSGIPDRPNCKGRAYDPNRYSQTNTEE